MPNTGREQKQGSRAGEEHLGLILWALKETFELFQLPPLLHRYKNLSFLISLNPAVFLVCKVNKKRSELFGSRGNFAIQENQTKHSNLLRFVHQQA